MGEVQKSRLREEQTPEKQQETLYALQCVDSKMDRIRLLRGELPLEVEDLEDEIEGLRTRVGNLESDIKARQDQISTKKQEIKEAETLIKKYTDQQKNVRNNREYDALSKELEYQKLEIELRNKQIREFKQANDVVNAQVESANAHIAERQLDLDAKKSELDSIINETAKEEAELQKESERLQDQLPDRLRQGYLRIRKNARNGLAVVTIVRNSCGGCFNRIPPQRQLDIKMRKKLIVCEYCGRIIVDPPQEEGESNTAE